MFWLLITPPILYSIPYEKAPVLKYLGLMLTIYPLSMTLAVTSHMVGWPVFLQSTIAAATLFTGLLIVGSASPMGQFDSISGLISVGSVVLFAVCLGIKFDNSLLVIAKQNWIFKHNL